MSTERSAWRGPSPGLIGAVVLAHVGLLGAMPERPSAPAEAPRASAWLTRAVMVPVPESATESAPPAAEAAPPAVARPAPPAPRARPRTAARPPVDPLRVARLNPSPDAPQAVAISAAHVEIAERTLALAPHDAAPAPVAPDPTPAPPVRAAAAATPLAPVRVPASTTLRYQVSGQVRGLTYQADAELRWQHDASRYLAEWSVSLPLVGKRTQRSEGAITAAGLVPERFAERARGERAAHFDPAGQRIRFSANTPDAEWQPGAQDRLSVTLQLAALLAAAPERYPPGARISMITAGVRDAEPWVWEVMPDETLHLAGRDLPSAHLLRQPRHEHDSKVELWLARPLGHLPVRLRVSQAGGDVADQQLISLPETPEK